MGNDVHLEVPACVLLDLGFSADGDLSCSEENVATRLSCSENTLP